MSRERQIKWENGRNYSIQQRMFFICNTTALSGIEKDKDVQTQGHREEGGSSSWEGSWPEVLCLLSMWLQAAGAETHCPISSTAFSVKWAAGTKLPDKMCAWPNATPKLALISTPSAKDDQMAMALWLPRLCHGGVHGAQGMFTAGMAIFITEAQTPLQKHCLHFWLHGLSLASSHSTVLDFSFMKRQRE